MFYKVYNRAIRLYILTKRLFKFVHYSKYLVAGKYCFSPELKIFILHQKKEIDFCSNILNTKIKKTCLPLTFLLRILNFLFSNKKYGSILLFSNSTAKSLPVSYKFFNLDKNSVTTIYESHSKFRMDINAYNQFSMYFKVPQILVIDEKMMLLAEKLILPTSDSRCKHKTTTYKTIINTYINYYKNSNRHSILATPQMYLTEAKRKGMNDRWCKFFASKLKPYADTFVPIYFQHGDLSSYNIIIEDGTNEIYFIDYEHQGNYVFFYDVFWYMQNLARQDNVYNIVEDYIKGVFDKEFHDLFKAVNLEFCRSLKEIYYIIFVLEMYNNRLFTLSLNLAEKVIEELWDTYSLCKKMSH